MHPNSGDFFGPDSSLGTVFGTVLDRKRTASASIVGPKWDPLHFKIVYKYPQNPSKIDDFDGFAGF